MQRIKKKQLKKTATLAWNQRSLYIMLFLPLAVYFLFTYVPMTKVYWAFTNYGEVAKSKVEFVGFYNFKRLLLSSGFKQAFLNTIILSFYNTVIAFWPPVILALFLNEIKSKWFKKTSQTIIYLPHFFSWAIVGGIFSLILAPKNSINEQISTLLGVQPIYFFTSLKHIRGLLVATNIWQGAGYGAIVYLAALSGIDPALYEAATMDGASRFQKMKYISIPCIKPMMVTMLILGLGKVLNIFGQVIAMCTEIVYSKVDTIQTYAYRTGIEQMQIGYSMATSLFKCVLSIVLVVVTDKLAKKLVDKDAGIF